ncbi:Gp37-like protein [Micromonospora sp. RP3T]|uniref:Gp37-like protein n=1 Tax=Micromonospora sp. RP3T TaxID=2135446 RepID=UPI003D70B89C
MAGQAEYTLLITTPDGSQELCDPIEFGNPRTGESGWSEIRLGPRRNDPGTGTITCAARPDVLDAVNVPDARVVARRETLTGDEPTIEMAGPIELPDGGYEARRDGLDGWGTLAVTFVDDLVLLAERLIYPDPARSATNQTTATKYTITAQGVEAAIRAVVNLNAGPGAHTSPDRRTPGLVLGPVNGILPGVTVSTSFTRDAVLSDAARTLAQLGAESAGILPRVPRLRVLPVNGRLEFVVELPPDLSDTIIFSRALGNVQAMRYAPEAPRDTVAIVGDATAGVGRIVKERTNTAAHAAGWRRREVWVDARGAANATELEQAGDLALTEGGPRTGFTLEPIETPNCRYGYDYPIGALVSAEAYEGGPFIPAVVMGADIVVTGKGETVTPIIGTEGDQITDRKAEEMRRLMRRMAQVEGAL